jgi:hypothetical protein
VVVGGTSAEFRRYLARESATYGRLIKSIKLTLD